MHHTNEGHTANAKRSCGTFATRGIPDKKSGAGGTAVLDATGAICCKNRFLPIHTQHFSGCKHLIGKFRYTWSTFQEESSPSTVGKGVLGEEAC